MKNRKAKILFLCTRNSCRSQMAAGWARLLLADSFESYSAGISSGELDALAVEVMAEVGVDISGCRCKHIDELHAIDFDYVVTVCGHAREACPTLPGRAKVIHKGFDDPPALAKDAKTKQLALSHYRRVRDEIRTFIEKLPQTLLS
ncbi:MAG: arsenate reductase ArsC [Planctomycetota bacterium]|nr:arsenate reductase ArsC [Planctomycetota bacterium]